MICLFACFIGGKSKYHKKLSECAHSYSPNQHVKINGKNGPSFVINLMEIAGCILMKNAPESSSLHSVFFI